MRNVVICLVLGLLKSQPVLSFDGKYLLGGFFVVCFFFFFFLNK